MPFSRSSLPVNRKHIGLLEFEAFVPVKGFQDDAVVGQRLNRGVCIQGDGGIQDGTSKQVAVGLTSVPPRPDQCEVELCYGKS